MVMVPSLAVVPTGRGVNTQDEVDGPDLQIEIEDPESVTLSDGSMEVTLSPGKDDADSEFEENLAERMTDGELSTLATDIEELVSSDLMSRKEWEKTYSDGLEVLGLRYEERTEPWDGACGVFSSLLAEAAIRFQAETIMETFPAAGPVRTEIIGAVTRDKEEAATRVEADMNNQLTNEMVEYRSEHERMLFNLGIAGAAFKKVYYDPNLGRQVSIFVPAEDLVLPYGASNIETSERATHLMRKTKHEVASLQKAGFYREVDLGEPVYNPSEIEKTKGNEQGFRAPVEDDRYQLAECHLLYDLPGFEDEDDEGEPTGIALPYVVTYDRGDNKVLAIRRNWKPDDKHRLKRQHFVQYTYIPGFGVYGLGLIHLIGGYARAGTSIIRQLVDAGTLSNLPGGLKSRGLRIKGDDTPINPGEFRDVDVPSGSIKDNVMTLPYKEPSQVLSMLLDKLIMEGRRLGAISDLNVSDMNAQAPVGTTLAILERSLKTMSAVQARVHYSMKQEFKLLKEIIREYAPAEYGYEPDYTDDRDVKQADYDMVEIMPVSDPNSATMAQRIMTHQAVIQLSTTAPQIYDLPHLHRQMIEALGLKNAEKIVPTIEDIEPTDPVSENMAALKMRPMQAFIEQNHDAHIQVHNNFIQDPGIQAAIGQNPQAQAIMGALQAHIAEHLGFSYRLKIQERLGVSMPMPGQVMEPEMANQLATMVAQASAELLAINKGQAAQAQAAQQAQDPLLQLQAQELQIKQQEVQRKAQKDAADHALAQQELQITAQQGGQKLQNQTNMDAAKIALDRQKAATEAHLTLAGHILDATGAHVPQGGNT